MRPLVEPQRGQILHLKVSETNTEDLPVIVPVLSEYCMLGSCWRRMNAKRPSAPKPFCGLT
jgi:hypothetical protein